MSIVTLTTDYGLRDHYVAALKGVILGIAEQVRIVDVTHDIEPYNVLHGAFVLREVFRWYPPGTIHLAVVDPGVGSHRRILLGVYAGRFVIAPDNGLATLLHREVAAEAMYVVENRKYFSSEPSATFHGRDIMAPVAAHLANGVPPSEFGHQTDRITMLPVEHAAKVVGQAIHGNVVYVDRFGTLVTNIRREQLEQIEAGHGPCEVLVDGTSIGPVRATFSDVPAGHPVALVGGGAYLEVAVNRGSARDRFGPHAAVRVDVRPQPS